MGELTPDNLRRLIEDMGTGPGWYASGPLYTWYAGMCAEAGLTPVSAKKFGMTLRELGYRPVLKRVDGKHVRGWFLHNRALRGAPPREAAAK